MPVEEDTIVKRAIQYYKWGLPLAVRHLRQFAIEFLLRKQPPQRYQILQSVPDLGGHWPRNMLSRHPQIKRVVARELDRTRAATMLKMGLFEQFFELFDSLLKRYKIAPQDTYNIDEKGYMTGAIQKSHVVVLMYENDALVRQDGNRDWVSVLEAISGDGEYLPSYIIFKAVNQQSSWFR
jgi:hypothetical protein